jgi:hypothetical protein
MAGMEDLPHTLDSFIGEDDQNCFPLQVHRTFWFQTAYMTPNRLSLWWMLPLTFMKLVTQFVYAYRLTQNAFSRADTIFTTHASLTVGKRSTLQTGSRNTLPVTVAERSKACTVFARSEAGIVGSNPTQGMDVWYV